jgi:predicted nucleic acid-binding protein
MIPLRLVIDTNIVISATLKPGGLRGGLGGSPETAETTRNYQVAEPRN